MVLARSLVRNVGFFLMLIFWYLSINHSLALAASNTSMSSLQSGSKLAKTVSSSPAAGIKSSKTAGTAPQPRSFYGGYGGHDLIDRGFGTDFLPILALIGFAVIFLPVLGALMASLTQFSAPIGFPLNQAVTTATVAGRRKRNVPNESIIKLMNGFEKFYRGYQAVHA
ncbi:uncharacterized protein LOC111254238 [Varroa destructor]|uniref:Uncharacterized protein n=1 Tax=Varroa destructor TaxID=109461 RepID=A0A7M7KQV6_VARDE|nr:uncharacterized protein LOC111254238 [Varroa destructor]